MKYVSTTTLLINYCANLVEAMHHVDYFLDRDTLASALFALIKGGPLAFRIIEYFKTIRKAAIFTQAQQGRRFSVLEGAASQQYFFLQSVGSHEATGLGKFGIAYTARTHVIR